MLNANIQTAIINEVQNDPSNQGYKGHGYTTYQVAIMMNTPINSGQTTPKPVPCIDIKVYAVNQGILPKILAAAQSSTDATLQGACATILNVFSDMRFQNIDFSMPGANALMSILLNPPTASPLITQLQHDTIIGMGTVATTTTRSFVATGLWTIPMEEVDAVLNSSGLAVNGIVT